jgi:hypothetical protein
MALELGQLLQQAASQRVGLFCRVGVELGRLPLGLCGDLDRV